MKLSLLAASLLLLPSCATVQDHDRFVVGSAHSSPSRILGEQRTIWIHVPQSSGGGDQVAGGRYPVIYLLDGEANFDNIVSMTEFMSSAGLCPPMIVVGIVHPDRMRDLTFGTDRETPGIVGRGDQFMLYVANELIPYVDSHYPTAPYKVFVGHSVGGLTVVNTLIHHPTLFNAYVSLDGALWWNNQQIVTEAKVALASQSYQGTALFMALANRMESGMDTVEVQSDTTEGTELIRSNLAFIGEISRHPSSHLRFKHTFYENDDHSSVRFIGEYDALRFIFDYYKLRIYNSQLDDPAFRLDSLLTAHFTVVSERIGYLVPPDESVVNNLAYYALRQRQFTKAEALFKLNVANYPKSANCYDGLGDLYLASGDTLRAIQHFKTTLSLRAVPETQKKLEALLRKS